MPMMGCDWAQLPPELLAILFGRLCPADVKRARASRSSWREAADSVTAVLAPKVGGVLAGGRRLRNLVCRLVKFVG